ncbi:hypothetical protein AD940_08790 [Gluconobacter thailandicus]|uniref:hypothetical protein n=1 Tax=Gluconobacter thailandicus TaxID=257438 RepID=UPI00077792CB|nr:hypothetical protein [Gluconobacter thailandicus]KXV34037.1 hypothetical protein AD940_08790 [Gluconobacter thailandicus]
MIAPIRHVTRSLPHSILTCVLISFTLVPASRAQPSSAKLEHLTPLSLHDGMNSFDGPNGPFSVFSAWRDNGNAWGYHMYLPTTVIEGKTNIIGIEATSEAANAPLQDHLSDAPHTGEDALSSIQFAKGLLDGKPSVLLFHAIRDPGTNPVPTPAPVTVYVYTLTTSDGAPGCTPSYFHLVKKIPVPGTFCSSDTALKAATGLPLSADADPPPSADGCLH